MNDNPDVEKRAGDLTPDEKLQYTIKGIERRSVDLMRNAAKHDGMKIGVWVSRRMREAAEASLQDLSSRSDSDSIKAIDSARLQTDSYEAVIELVKSMRAEIEIIREDQKILISGLLASTTERR